MKSQFKINSKIVNNVERAYKDIRREDLLEEIYAINSECNRLQIESPALPANIESLAKRALLDTYNQIAAAYTAVMGGQVEEPVEEEPVKNEKGDVISVSKEEWEKVGFYHLKENKHSALFDWLAQDREYWVNEFAEYNMKVYWDGELLVYEVAPQDLARSINDDEGYEIVTRENFLDEEHACRYQSNGMPLVNVLDEGFSLESYAEQHQKPAAPKKESAGQRGTAQERFEKYTKELAEKEAIANPDRDVKHRIASLKRKIARAQKALA